MPTSMASSDAAMRDGSSYIRHADAHGSTFFGIALCWFEAQAGMGGVAQHDAYEMRSNVHGEVHVPTERAETEANSLSALPPYQMPDLPPSMSA